MVTFTKESVENLPMLYRYDLTVKEVLETDSIEGLTTTFCGSTTKSGLLLA